jgi:nucleoside 2-deoxyribosyltransferase
MSTEIERKCPLTGLDALESHKEPIFYYRIPTLENFYYGTDDHIKLSKLDPTQKGKLFQWVYQEVRNNKSGNTIVIPSKYLNTEYTGSDSPLNQKITPTQKMDCLLEYLYKGMESVGTSKTISNLELLPILATVEIGEVGYFLQVCSDKKWIQIKKGISLNGGGYQGESDNSYFNKPNPKVLYLTLEGFEAYEALKKGKADSDFIFMALEFGSKGDAFYKDHLKGFLQKEGFELKDQRVLNKAGNVNVSMEANIRKCKFLIADITPTKTANDGNAYPNPNVMWEAGFAEGLNKPVFYLSGKKIENHPFDVRNHYCIEYGDYPKKACERLKDAIDNTFAQKMLNKI